jgi:hypothetical protein
MIENRITIGRDSIGRKIDFTYELKIDKNGFKEFSMCADYWNKSHTDIIRGGQCCDDVLKSVKTWSIPKNKALRMVEIWEKYHLNGMKAGCEHQRKEQWEDQRIDPAELPEKCHANRDEKGVYAIWVYPSEVLNGYFKKGIWYAPPKFIDPNCVHKNGLLTKKCEVCGYEYGSKWLKEEIPEEILCEIQMWGV